MSYRPFCEVSIFKTTISGYLGHIWGVLIKENLLKIKKENIRRVTPIFDFSLGLARNDFDKNYICSRVLLGYIENFFGAML